MNQLDQLIAEGRDAPLYHGTGHRTLEIIRLDLLKPETTHRPTPSMVSASRLTPTASGISLTRSLRFAKAWSSGIVLVLDQTKLSKEFRILPINFYNITQQLASRSKSTRQTPSNTGTTHTNDFTVDVHGSESEEFVQTDRPIKLSRFLTEIIVDNHKLQYDINSNDFHFFIKTMKKYLDQNKHVKLSGDPETVRKIMNVKLIDESHSLITTFRNFTKNVDHIDPKNKQPWSGSADQLMNTIGFRSIGTGNYAQVYHKVDYPYVVKLFLKDAAYLKWLHFAQQNQHNPYVPKIRGKVVKITSTVFAVRLEQLSDCSKSSETYRNVHDLIQLLMDPEDALEGVYHSDRANIPITDSNLRSVLTLMVRNRRLLDIHYGNVLSRGTHPVIIDPFYNYLRGGQFTIDPDDISQFTSLF